MKLLVARHGETDWNIENRVLGISNIPLNAHGIEQAHELAEKLYEADLHIDLILSSPLDRTFTTAAIVSERLGVPCFKEDRLIEQCFGSLDGVPRTDPRNLAQRTSFIARYPDGGESYLDVATRIYPFLEELKQNHSEKTILLVTHGGILRLIESYFSDTMSNDDFFNYFMPNCGYKEFVM